MIAMQPGKTYMNAAKAPYRFAHTTIRVHDLTESSAFHCDVMRMTLLRRSGSPARGFTNVFIGFGSDDASIELTHNWDRQTPYEKGIGFGHLEIGVPNVHEACSNIRQAGGTIVRESGPMLHGTRVRMVTKLSWSNLFRKIL